MGFSLGLSVGLGSTALVPVPASLELPAGVDEGTLVPSDLLVPDWVHHEYSADAPTVAAYSDPTDGDIVLVNGGSNAPANGRLYSRFVAPAGCTSVTLKIRVKAVSGTPTLYMCIFLPGVGPVTGSAGVYLAPTLTGTMTEYTSTVPVTPGVEYGVLLFFNAVGQVPALIESVRVEPDAGSTGLFGGTFYRVPLTHSRAELNAEPTRYKNSASMGALSQASPGARWDVVTDATQFALEGGPSSGYAQYSRLAAEVDGEPSVNEACSAYSIKTFSLASGEKTVSPVVPPLTTDGVDVAGTWPRALYVGPCSSLSLPALEVLSRRVLVYGDSITAGFSASVGQSHWTLLRRAGTCAPLLKAMGSVALWFDGPTALARQAWVDSLAALDFDDIWLAIGTNDWGANFSAFWATVADFQAAYSDLLDRLVAAYPGVNIYAQTPLPRSGTTNANGHTLAQYRQAIQTAASGRPTVTIVDGTSLCSISDLPDGTHPDDAGCEVLASSIEAVLDGA